MLRLARLVGLGLVAVLAGCVIVPERQHALVLEADGTVAKVSMRCDDSAQRPLSHSGTLDPRLVRLSSWNLHKQADAGWEYDLRRLIEETDVLLIQEAEVAPEFRAIVEQGGLKWLLASAFEYLGSEYGVLTATRVEPETACTLRAYEPLLGIPKAMLITRYRLAGRDDMLAVANLHAINFTLGIGAYRAQLEALADTLSRNPGPIVIAGDFNTWNEDREAAVRALASRLSLVPVELAVDARTRFMGGHIFDRVYAKGVEFVGASAWSVSSSDHNPLLVSFRVR
jgi:endonuclease/exonuclease/phosphatase (EEP) superfamily protein YafD